MIWFCNSPTDFCLRLARQGLLGLVVLSSLVPACQLLAAGCFSAPSGLVAWWPGDGNANDIASTNNGTLEGGATATAAGVVGSAFTFDGTNAYVQIPDAPALKPTNLTVEAWVNFSGLDSAVSGTAPAGDQYIVFKQNSLTYNFEGYSLEKFRLANGDAFMFTVSSASGQSVVLLSATLVSTSVWYHVAAVRGSNFMQLYVNGQLESQTNVSFAQDYGTLPLYLGTSHETYWDGKLKGSLDEVSLYNRALSSNEVAAIYAAGAAGKCKGASLVAQPQSQTVVVGSNVLFTVTATGFGLLSYQWQFNGASISAASNTSLVLTNVQITNAGSYTVVVTNSLGSVTSAVAVLTVLGPPSITSPPASVTNECTSTAIFSVTASGTPPPSYQWYFNGNLISNATSTSLGVANVHAAQQGNYTVVVTNSAGSVTSAPAVLSVVDTTPPAITLVGANPLTNECHATFVDPGATASDMCAGSLGVTTNSAVNPNAVGVYTIKYTATDPSGNSATNARTVYVVDTTAPVITLNGANPLTNECHAAFADPGVTASDTCAGSLGVTTNSAVNPNAVGVYTIKYTATDPSGNSATNTRTVYVVDTTAPVITLNGANPLTNECHAAFADPGATASDSCAGSVGVTTNSTVNPNAVGVYTIRYTASDPSGNSATNTRAVYVVDTTAPVITLNGANPLTNECHAAFVDPGATASDGCAGSVGVTTNSTVNPNAVGVYAVKYTATDPSGNSATNTRTVYVVDTTPPVITLNGANPLTNECHAAFVDPGATASDGCAGSLGVTTNSAVNPNAVGVYTIKYTATDPSGNSATNTRTVYVVDTTAPVITLNGANPLTNECHAAFVDPGATAIDACAGSLGVTTNSTVNPNAVGVYTIKYIATDPSGNSATNTRTVYAVDTTPPVITINGANPLTNECYAAFTDPGATATDKCAGSVAVTTNSTVNPNAVGVYTIKYIATDPSGNSATNTRTVYVVAVGCFSAPLGLVDWWPGDGNANDIAGTNNGTLEGGTTATAAGVVGSAFTFDGTNAYVQIPDAPALKPTNLTVEAWVNFSGLDSAVSGTAPAGDQYIVFKQNSLTYNFEGYSLEKFRLANGDAFMFTVSSASGQSVVLLSATLVSTSVWYHVAAVRGSNFMQLYVNGQLESQTNVSFAQDYGTLPLYLGTSHETYWDGKLKGSLDEVSLYNRALSSNEVAAIYAAGAAGKCKGASLVTQPQSQTVVVGSNVLFTVTATGFGLLSYQWQFNGASISAASNTSLVLTNVQTTNAGSYTVVVTNSLGSVTSAVAVLTVLGPPSITSPPASVTNECTSTAIFSVTASGTPPPSYQWYFNGNLISNATSTSLGVVNVHAAQQGNYTVVVTNSAGSVTSAPAVLSVVDTTPPAITLVGANPLTNECHATFVDPGATASDMCAGSLGVTTNSAVNPNAVGVYTIKYTATDPSGNSATNARTVYVVDTTAPVITLNGANPLTNECHAAFADPGVTASDTCAGSLGVTTNSAVNPNAIGVYTIKYTATDPSGNSATNTRTVYVVDTTAPVITLNGANPLTNECHAAFADPGATASDSCAGSVGVTTNSTVNPNAVGVYTIRYTASDPSGNSATNTRAVYVVDTTAPVITLNGANPLTNECHAAFVDPGATASDGCAGSVGVTTNSTVNPNAVGVYTIRYTASDPSGNSATNTRAVYVVDTTAPVILSCVTNLVLPPTTNCQGTLPDLTSTNYIVATDLCGSVNVTQIPPAGTALPLGTNLVTLTAADSAGNVTNCAVAVFVPGAPNIISQPTAVTVLPGNNAMFSVVACGSGPLHYQWRKNGADLLDGGNLSGATDAALTLANAQTIDAGGYQVVVTNIAGSVTSAVASLTVIAVLQPGSQTAGAVVLVNSQSARYLDFQHFIQPYLDNFGFPYTVQDIATNVPGPGISNCAVIIIGHRQLDTNLTFLTAAVQANLSLAVSNGAGLVSFDCDLYSGSAPRYQFVQNIFGFSYGSGASGSSASLPPTEPSSQMQYITARHPTNDLVVFRGSISLPGITVPAGATTLVSVGGQPLVAVVNYGQGRAVQWGSYDWMVSTVLGPVDGLDDVVWRGVVWAARKPFVMRGLPNLLVLRMDDTSGPFWWVHVANQMGFKPWLGLFLSNVAETNTADLAGLVTNGNATTSVHSLDCCTTFFYYDHDVGPWPDNVMSNNYYTATQWHTSHGIPISKFVVAHYSEIGPNSFAGLQAWGVEFIGLEVVPGTEEYLTPPAPWLIGGPYRLYETPQPGAINWPLWYADFLTVPGHPEFNGQFFNCLVEVRDESSCNDWCPANDDVTGSITRGTQQAKRELDSMVMGQLYTHEWQLIPIPQSSNQTPISSNNWSSILQGITNNLGTYTPNYVTMDYACQYVRATRTSRLLNSSYDPASGQVTAAFSGQTDLDIGVYVFVGADSAITSTFGNVPAFSMSSNHSVLLSGPLAIINTPSSRTNNAGTAAAFSVGVSGAWPLSFRWYRNGTNALSDGGRVSGASSATLTISNVLGGDAGSYMVVITNALGSVTSALPAVLTVVDPTITTQPVSQTNTAGTIAVFTVVASGSTPAYQWLKNGAPISGATNTTLSLTNVSSSDAGSYSVTVSNVYGSMLSSNATLAVFYVPTANNDSYGVAAGTTLTVPAPGVLGNDTVAGVGNLTATLVNGPIHGTLSLSPNGGFTYTPLTNYVGTDSFAYQAVNGAANSGVATVTLSITADGVWFSDDFTRLADPGPLSPWMVQSGNWAVTGGALTTGTNPIQSYGYAYIVNSWTNYSVAGQIQFSSSNAWGGGIGGRLNPATGAHYAAWVYPEGSPGGSNVLKLLKFQTWTSFGYNGTSGAAMAEASLAATGTNWHTVKLAFYGSQIAVYYDGNQMMSVRDTEAQPYSNGGISADMWTYLSYYTMSVDEVIVRPLVVDDSYSGAGDTALMVDDPGVLGNDTGVYATNLVAVLVSGPANGTLNLSTNGGFTYSPATNYYGTDSFSYEANQGTNNLGTGTVTVTVVPDVPVIVQGPSNRTNATGTTAVFSVGAGGALPLSYQWCWNVTNGLSDGGRVNGARSATLSLINVRASDAGGYNVIVSNVSGSVTSPVAALEVVVPPQFTSIAFRADRNSSLWLTAVSNLTYRIDASTDLFTWAVLTNLPNPSGTIQFIDLEATNFPQRFYRAVWVP